MKSRYDALANDFTVTLFDRPLKLCRNCSIKMMAEDVIDLMQRLQIRKASFLGVSQGGMIA